MDIIEQVAAALHEGWLCYYDAQGYKFGPVSDRTAKKHAHFIPWSALDEEAKNQDRFQATVLLLAWKAGDISEINLPKQIHEVWRKWEQISRPLEGKGPHPHDGPFAEKHPSDPEEHFTQAKHVWAVLQKAQKESQIRLQMNEQTK